MRYLPLVVTTLAMVNGCGSGVGSARSARDRVTQQMRQACWWLTDVQIASNIVIVEANREAGFTLLDQVNIDHQDCVFNVCPGDLACVTDCDACGNAVTDAVFKRIGLGRT